MRWPLLCCSAWWAEVPHPGEGLGPKEEGAIFMRSRLGCFDAHMAKFDMKESRSSLHLSSGFL